MASDEPMLNYFTSIEEHFTSKPGVPLVLSSRDFELISEWKSKGIPLDAVIRGIDIFFDKELGRKRRKRHSLRNCAKSVISIWEERKEAMLGAGRKDCGPEDLFSSRLFEMAELLKLSAEKTVSCAQKLELLKASEMIFRLTGEEDPELIEKNLNRIEDQLLKALLENIPEKDDVHRAAEIETSGLRIRVNTKTAEKILKNSLRKIIRERFSLPELTLFSF